MQKRGSRTSRADALSAVQLGKPAEDVAGEDPRDRCMMLYAHPADVPPRSPSSLRVTVRFIARNVTVIKEAVIDSTTDKQKGAERSVHLGIEEKLK